MKEMNLNGAMGERDEKCQSEQPQLKLIVEKLNQVTIDKIFINQQTRKSKTGSVIGMMNE